MPPRQPRPRVATRMLKTSEISPTVESLQLDERGSTSADPVPVGPKNAAGSAVTASSVEQKMPSKPTFRTQKARELYSALVAQYPQPNDTFTQAELSELRVATSDQQLLNVCQELLNLGLFQLLTIDNKVCYRLKSLDNASKVQSLGQDARLIYDTIEAAGSLGIWTKTLKAKTNLHQTVLTRVLKNLESKTYVKQIKNARFPGRKIYMLQHLHPTDEVTGGPFFSDGELDEGLIEYASYFVVMYVRRNSWREGPRFRKPIKASLLHRDMPAMLATEGPNSKILLPHPAGYSDYPTAADILGMLDSSGIFENKHFTEADLQILLDVLVFDNKLEVVRSTGRMPLAQRTESTTAAEQSHGGTESDADDDLPRPAAKKRRVYGLRGSISPQPRRRSLSQRETPESEAESETGADTMYRSVWRPGPPPPRPESIVVANEEQASTDNMEEQAGNQPKRQDAENETGPTQDESQAAERIVLPQKSKERREQEQIEELLALSNPVSETPCARCPVFDFCEEGTRIDATTCEYFAKWLEEGFGGEQKGGHRDAGQSLSRPKKSTAGATALPV